MLTPFKYENISKYISERSESYFRPLEYINNFQFEIVTREMTLKDASVLRKTLKQTSKLSKGEIEKTVEEALSDKSVDLAHTGAGAFCPQQVHGKTLTLFAGESQQKYQYTHAAQPVAEAAPIQQSLRQGLHIGQNGRAGGGKAGHDLEESIDIQGDFPGNIERQAADQTEYHPAGTDADQTLLGIKGAGRIAAQQEKHSSHGQQQSEGPQKAENCRRFAPVQADQQGRDHEKPLDG